MQYVLDIDPRADDLLAIHRRLLRAFDYDPEMVEDTPRLTPVDQMIRSMLGARTQDIVSWPAFERLRNAFPSWEKCRQAGAAKILPLIADVTFAEDKAKRVPAAIAQIIARRGHLDLDFLATWSVPNALKWLSPLPGVGPKVAAAILNFSTLNKRALVLDSHHLRILKRLGFTKNTLSTAKAYDLCMEILPASWQAEDYLIHHVLIKRLGQTVCHHKAPDCSACPLSRVCPSAVHKKEGTSFAVAPSPSFVRGIPAYQVSPGPQAALASAAP